MLNHLARSASAMWRLTLFTCAAAILLSLPAASADISDRLPDEQDTFPFIGSTNNDGGGGLRLDHCRCDGTGAWENGDPDGVQALSSQLSPSGWVESWTADDFAVSPSSVLQQAHWLTVDDPNFAYTGTAEILILLNDCCHVGQQVYYERFDAIRTDTGSTLFGRTVYCYEMNNLNISLNAGYYFLGLRPVENPGTAQTFWLTAPLTGCDAQFLSVFFGYPNWTPWQSIIGFATNVSFCLSFDQVQLQPGGCCLPIAGERCRTYCEITSGTDCIKKGGTYRGDGTDCCTSCNPDCNGNGIEDWEDILAGISKDCNGNCIPDECDIASGYSQDTNGNGIPDECENVGDCPRRDLDATIGTGEDGNGDGKDDNWNLTSAPSGVPTGPATLSNTHPYWKTILGTSWISGFPDGGTGNHPTGDYVYETCFCLDPRFSNAFLSLDLRTDDGSKVYLNGNLIGSTGGWSFSSTVPTNIQVTNQSFFHSGKPNCITIVVTNSGGPTGLNAQFLIAAQGGLCCDCNNNDVSDATDISNGTSQDTNGNGIPDECEKLGGACCYRTIDCIFICTLVGSDDDCAALNGTYYGEGSVCNGVPCQNPDCNGNGVEDWQDIIVGTSQDCNKNCIPDECDIANGTSIDSNGNGVPDECEKGGACCYQTSDCIWVCVLVATDRECGFYGGTYYGDGTNCLPPTPCMNPDCNGNGIEDWEDILNGSSKDCNKNCIPDECDIASGFSKDLNGNGIPDECEPGGACCLGPNTCVQLPQSDCVKAGGIYYGDGSLCANVDCSCPARTIDDDGYTGIDADNDGFDDNWNLISAPSSVPLGPATISDTNSAWQTIFGTSWISAFPNGGTGYGHPIGEYTYQWCFCLDPRYFDAQLFMDIRTDNDAKVYLNGNLIASFGSNFGASSPYSIFENDPNKFQVGTNCVKVVVTNRGGPTGMNAHTLLVARDGRCCDDCNKNGVWDYWDIVLGTSTDCNNNGIPDDCELIDCNGNGIHDACDIANGTSSDCNKDGIPDDCACNKCDRKTVEICYQGGCDDNFAPPADTSNQNSIVLSGHSNISCWKDFDVTTEDCAWTHTFASLPRGMCAAMLEIRMKPGYSQPETDAMYLGFSPGPSWAWGRNLNSLTGGLWTSGGAAQTFCYDLAAMQNADGSCTNLLPHMNANCCLDILIQDDTTIDYVKLHITVCPCERKPHTYLAGRKDNFSKFRKDPPPSRSKCLDGFRAPNQWKGFDDNKSNRGVGHTFTGICRGAVRAELEVRMRAHSDIPGNDSINLEATCGCGGPLLQWGARLTNLPESGGTWNAGQVATFTLDLGSLAPNGNDGNPPDSVCGTKCTSLLGALNDGALDVYVQDDTAVDYMRLRVWCCCEKHRWFGLEHDELGTGQLETTEDGSRLRLYHIGSTGQDGVRIGLGESQGFDMRWAPLDSLNLPVGSTMRLRSFGVVDGDPDFDLLRVEARDVGDVDQLSFDLSSLGVTQYAIEVENEGVVVYSSEVASSTGDGNTKKKLTDFHIYTREVQLGDGKTAKRLIAELTYEAAEAIVIDGQALVGDLIRVIALDGEEVESISGVEMLLQDIPSLEIEYEALRDGATSYAALGVAYLDSSSRQLMVSNIGSSGQDGVSIEFLPVRNWKIDLNVHEALEEAPVEATVHLAARKRESGIDEGDGTLHLTKRSEAELHLEPSFAEIGAPTYRVVAMLHGEVVFEKSGLGGGAGGLTHGPYAMERRGDPVEEFVLHLPEGTMYSPELAAPIEVDELHLQAEGGSSSSAKSGVDVTASDVEELTLAGSSFPAADCDSTRPPIVYATPVAVGAADGTSWDNATTLVHALAIASCESSPVTEIWVSEGTHHPDSGSGDRTKSFGMRSGVAIYGGFIGEELTRDERDPAANITVLSGDLEDNDGDNFAGYDDNSYHVVVASGVDSTAVLDGFVIRGGNANGAGDPDFDDAGGGMRCSEEADPTIRHCTFRENRGKFGGGVELFRGKGTFVDCRFLHNTAYESEGGAVSSNRGQPTFRRCAFEQNSAAQLGGAVRATSATPVLIDCTMDGNSAGASGGAVSGVRSTSVLENCVIRSNTSAGNGGAISTQVSGTMTIINGLIAGNRATGIGGGVRNDGPTLTVINSTIIDNRASTGGGFALRTGSAAIANSVAYFNQDGGGTDESAQIDKGTGALALSYSDVQGLTGGFGGSGNIGGNPGLIANGVWNNNGTPGDPSDDFYVSGDPRLGGGSPCVDAADNSALPADTHDLDGDSDTAEKLPIDLYGGARRVDDAGATDTGNGSPPIVDMGAHERVGPPQTRGDMNCDGLTDFNDIDAFVSALIGQDQYESEYPGCNWLNGDINGDGGTNFDDIDGFVECLINGGC